MLDWKNVAAELKNRLDGYERRTDIRGGAWFFPPATASSSWTGWAAAN